MLNRLPDIVDASRLAAHGARIEGDIPLGRLERLRSALHSTVGEAHVLLEFSLGAHGLVIVRGRVVCDLPLVCQRCSQRLVRHVEAAICVGLVQSDEEADQLPDEFEPHLLEGGKLAPATLVEDELILALPVVPRHDDDCGALEQVVAEPPTQDEQRPNPFAVLAALRKKPPDVH
jgi:uncharacterized protein